MHVIPWVLDKSNPQIIFQIKEGGMFKSHIINHTSKSQIIHLKFTLV